MLLFRPFFNKIRIGSETGIKVNGETIYPEGEMTVADIVEGRGYRAALIAVEVNGAIVKKADYDKTVLRDGDKVEIVSFVGGG